MANPEHLKILRQGVEAWNVWRKEHNSVKIDLSSADLREIEVSGSDFSKADLRAANLSDIQTSDSSFEGANLQEAILNGTCFDNTDFTQADLFHVAMFNATLLDCKLDETNFCKAEFGSTLFSGSSLLSARFKGAILMDTHFRTCDLSSAKFNLAQLNLVLFCETVLENASFAKASLSGGVFADVDLSNTIGLDQARHNGPSTIGTDTIYASHGRIPEKFLKDAGVPEEIVDIARSIRNGPPIQWHSCFISYSTKDEEFARRLHARMREANMRVWFAPEDLKGGKKLHEQLFEAIQIHDRLLIVLSEHSIKSEWVMTEIRKARETEKKENRRKLFPIRLTDFETLRDWTCFDADTGKDLAVEVREYFIPDFSNWKVLADGHPAAFESAFARLKKDLEAENSKKP
jgi:uncharacterized protein YjbI with pentapeptide repeats